MSKVGSITEVTTKTDFYSDLFTDFTRHANTGELNKKTNENAVKQIPIATTPILVFIL